LLRPIRPRPTGYIYYLQSLGTYYQLSIPKLVTWYQSRLRNPNFFSRLRGCFPPSRRRGSSSSSSSRRSRDLAAPASAPSRIRLPLPLLCRGSGRRSRGSGCPCLCSVTDPAAPQLLRARRRGSGRPVPRGRGSGLPCARCGDHYCARRARGSGPVRSALPYAPARGVAHCVRCGGRSCARRASGSGPVRSALPCAPAREVPRALRSCCPWVPAQICLLCFFNNRDAVCLLSSAPTRSPRLDLFRRRGPLRSVKNSPATCADMLGVSLPARNFGTL
jgi:hypothetical protein